VVTFANRRDNLNQYGEVIAADVGKVTLRVPKAEIARVTARLLTDLPVDDLTIEDPPITEVIERVFAQETPEERVT